MSETPEALAHREDESDTHYEPVFKATEQVVIRTNEEDEDVSFKMRAKLFRFEPSSSEWKERGTGDIKILEHRETKNVRLVMRRDKTLKVCANHLITCDMRLQPNIGSDRSWVWKTSADYADDTPKPETLAIRFANPENATQFKIAFEDAQKKSAALSSTANETENEKEGSGKEVGVREKEKEEAGAKEDEAGAKKEDEAGAKKEDEAEAGKKDDTV